MNGAVLLIEHYVAQSPIHGLGTFSSKFVRRGEKVWTFHRAVNALVPATEFVDLPAHIFDAIKARTEFLVESESFLTSLDGDQFVNHSDQPNTVKRGADWYASRDICEDEEITCDYRQTLVLGFNPDTGLPHNYAPKLYP